MTDALVFHTAEPCVPVGAGRAPLLLVGMTASWGHDSSFRLADISFFDSLSTLPSAVPSKERSRVLAVTKDHADFNL